MGGVGPFGKIKHKKCCCSQCTSHCCPDLNLEDTTFTNIGLGPGSLTCPDQPLCLTVPCFNGWTLDPGVAAVLEEIAGEPVCAGFVTTGEYEIEGLTGSFVFEAAILCVGNGLAYKAFVRYSQSLTSLIPENVWIETLAGFTCPDCAAIGTGNNADAELYFDVFVDCNVCNSADYDYGPPELGCTPDTIYSIRYYFTGQGVCL